MGCLVIMLGFSDSIFPPFWDSNTKLSVFDRRLTDVYSKIHYHLQKFIFKTFFERKIFSQNLLKFYELNESNFQNYISWAWDPNSNEQPWKSAAGRKIAYFSSMCRDKSIKDDDMVIANSRERGNLSRYHCATSQLTRSRTWSLHLWPEFAGLTCLTLLKCIF